MKTIKNWIDEDVNELKVVAARKGGAHEFNVNFHRVIPRAVFKDRDIFLSPASGISVYSEIVNSPKDELIQVKGKKFSINDLTMMQVPEGRYYVLSVFMSFYDQHSNYVPYDSIYKEYKDLDPIQTYNMSMLEVEEVILDTNLVKYDAMDYLFNNQRRLNIFEIPKMNNYRYYVTQIADSEVNQIVSFHDVNRYLDQNNFVRQGDPFGKIQKGSSCELILPLDNAPFEIEEILVPSKTNLHIEAGIDQVIKIKRK